MSSLYEDREEELWTPWNEGFGEFVWTLKKATGSWLDLGVATGIRVRVLRYLREGNKTKAVSMTMVERLIEGTGMGDIRAFRWFTAEELVEMGVWKIVPDGRMEQWRWLDPR